jgi:hypothetical protein
MSKVKLVGDIVEYEGVRVAWLLPQKSCNEARRFREYISDRNTQADELSEESFREIVEGIKAELEMLRITIEGLKDTNKNDALKLVMRVSNLKDMLED